MRATRPPDDEDVRRYVREHYWDGTVGDHYLRRCAREIPDEVAIVDAGTRLAFAEVDEQARRLAAGLTALGVEVGDVVAFQLPNWHEAVITYQAILKVGAIANPIVPIYRGRELRFILGQGQAKVAIIPAEHRGYDFVQLYAGLRQELRTLQEIVVVRGLPAAGMRGWRDVTTSAEADAVPAASPADPDDISLLLYTSGTTADPKGVLHSHNTLGYEARSVRDWFGLNERDAIFNPSPVTHVTGVLCALTIPFVVGCKLVLQDVWEAGSAAAQILQEQCSFMIFATPFLQGLTSLAEQGQGDFSSIRTIVCGGAEIPYTLIRRASQHLAPVVRMYGATEAPSTTAATRWDPFDRRARTDGRWMHPTEGRIVAAGETVPPGSVGEVEWRGPDMFLGYLDPALNHDSFTSDGFFRTGDLAVQDADGYLNVKGRTKDIINRGGEKISALEIENLIYTYPGVRETAVVAMPDPVLVERACAFVVLEPGTDLSLEELTGHLRAHDIATQKLPERLEVVEELPKTPSGKVQKYRLRHIARAVTGGDHPPDAGARAGSS